LGGGESAIKEISRGQRKQVEDASRQSVSGKARVADKETASFAEPS